jgi:signal transduction histidine kinase
MKVRTMVSIFALHNIQSAPFSLIILFTVILMLFMGAIVYMRNFRDRSNFAFFTISLTVAIWLSCQFLFKIIPFSPEGEKFARAIMKVQCIGVSYISFTFSFFVICFLKLEKRFKHYLWFGFSVSTVFMLLFLFSDVLASGVNMLQFSLFKTYSARYTRWGILFVSYFVIIALFTFYILLQSYRRSNPGLRKNQMRVFLIAYAVAYVALIDFLPGMGVKILPLGIFFIDIYILLTARALFKEKIFDIKNVFLTTFANVLFLILFFGIIFFSLLDQRVYRFAVLQSPLILSLLLIAVFSLFYVIHSALRPAIQKFISKNVNDINKHLVEFFDRIKEHKTSEGLVDIVYTTIVDSLGLDSCKIYLRTNNRYYSKGMWVQIDDSIANAIMLLQRENIKEIHEYKNILYLHKYEYIRTELSALMETLATQCTVPVFYKGEFLAYITLGGKKDGSELSEAELGFLKSIQGEFGVHLHATMLEQEYRNHQEQLYHVEKLATIGTLVSGVAHEINNPNNAIFLTTYSLENLWNYLQPVLNERVEDIDQLMVGEIPYPEMKREFSEALLRTRRNSERIKKIVEELRIFSKKETVQLTQETAINHIVASALTVVDNSLRKSTTRLSVSYAENVPSIKGDPQQLEQVVINLLNNACQSLPTQEQGIYVSTSVDEDRDHVRIIIRDEGKGIPKEVMKRLFEPFYTTKGPEGTGLGLSICNRIVQNHQGKLNIESEPGKGTTATDVLRALTGN